MLRGALPIAPGDRVIVVGAGPAGLDAAWKLERRGIDVRVLERGLRTGGKTLTLEIDGGLLEMGACFLHNAYGEVDRLLAELGLPPAKPLPGGSATLSGHRTKASLHAVAAVGRYLWLHRRLLGAADSGLYRRPGTEALELLALPAQKLIERYRLQSLENVLRRGFSAQGYGYLDDVPALYLLLWIEPRVLLGLVRSVSTRTLQRRSPMLRQQLAVTRVLPSGFGPLFQAIADRLHRPVDLGVEVTSVARHRDGIVLRTGDASVEAEWLLWTAPPHALAAVLTDPDDVESQLLGGRRSFTLCSTAYSDDPVPGYTAAGHMVGYFQDRMGTEGAGHWYGDRHDSAIWPPAEAPPLERRVALQFHPAPDVEPALLRTQLESDWRAAGRSGARVLKGTTGPLRQVWDYFHHWSPDEIRRGRPWDLLEAQGRRRVALLGGAAWFESVEHVLRYNRVLLSDRQMVR